MDKTKSTVVVTDEEEVKTDAVADNFENKEEAEVEVKTEKQVEETETTEEVAEEFAETEEKEQEDSEEEVVQEFSKTFKLSHNDIRTKIYEATGYEHYIIEVYDDEFISEVYDSDSSDYHFVKVKYAKSGDAISVDLNSAEKVSIEFVTDRELTQLEVLRSQLADFEKENETLKGTLSTYQTAEREAQESELFSKYTELDGITEYEALKEKVSEFSSLEDLEKEIAMVFVKNKANITFSKPKETNTDSVTVSFDDKSEEDAYGGLLKGFSKITK